MANFTRKEIITLLENHLKVGITTTATDPTQEKLATYINIAMRDIAYELEPNELKSEAVNIATVAGANSVTKPSTLLVIKDLFLNNNSNYKHLEKKPFSSSINPTELFKDESVEINFYEERSGKILFDGNFGNSNAAGLKAFGILSPTDIDITDLTVEINLSREFNMLIVYKSAILFYQSDFDEKNLGINMQLETSEKQKLRSFIGGDVYKSITLDRRFWNMRRI